MKVGLVVNVLGTEKEGQTTYRLASQCVERGHDVWITSAGNFSLDPDDATRAYAVRVPAGPFTSAGGFQRAVKRAPRDWVTLDELDVLLLRNNPSVQSPWAQHAGITFGRIAMRHGVLVLNDPNGLAKALNKLYLQTFPESVRPRTLIARNEAKIEAFVRDVGSAVLKPLQGSGGMGVFLIREGDLANLSQIVRSVSRDGYVVVQEYLPAAAEGDVRLFLMIGEPLVCEGKYAAFRRVRSGDDMRSNIHAGGKLRRAVVDDTMLRLAAWIKPRLVEDGMFFVGLDIVGDRLLEINVFSPGGLGSAQRFEKVDFTVPVVQALERKVEHVRHGRRHVNNVTLATL